MGENPKNPGVANKANWTFSNGQRTWQEPMDLVETLKLVFEERGHQIHADGGILLELDSQLSFRPLLVSMEPQYPTGAKTTTTIEIKHPSRIHSPVFDFQHAVGSNLEESLGKGFRQWFDSDFAVLCEAVREQAKDSMELRFPPGDCPERRVTFGPVLHMREKEPALDSPTEEHPFCPCCLFTKSLDAFQPLLRSPGFYAIRLFASRDEHGKLLADCRVNGLDHPEGKRALIQYAKKWQTAGVEFRKQYVLIQDVSSAPPPWVTQSGTP